MATIPLGSDSLSFDAEGIREFVWPVPYSDLLGVQSALYPRLPGTIREVKDTGPVTPFLQTVADELASVVLTLYLGRALHTRSTDAGHDVVGSGTESSIDAVATGGVPRTVPQAEKLLNPEWGHREVPQIARRAKWSLRWNSLDPRGIFFLGSFPGPVATQASQLIAYRARNTNQPVSFRPTGVFFNAVTDSIESATAGPTLSTDAMRRVVDVVSDAFAAGNETLPEDLREYFERWLVETTGAIYQLVTALRQAGDLPETLWTGSGLHESVLSHAVKRAGGTVVCHDHGAGSGLFNIWMKTVRNFEFADTFVTFNPAQAASIRRKSPPDVLVSESHPEVVSLPESGDSVPIREPSGDRLSGTMQPVTSGSRVMYVSPLYTSHKIRLAPIFHPYQEFDFQYRVLARLREWEYEPVHKPHPGSRLAVPDAFETLCPGAVFTSSFESVMDSVDAFVYEHPRSTTFPIALWSDKPIALLDFGHSVLTSEERRLLSERCVVLDGEVTDSNRLTVDWQDLRDGLEVAHERTDATFPRRYFSMPAH